MVGKVTLITLTSANSCLWIGSVFCFHAYSYVSKIKRLISRIDSQSFKRTSVRVWSIACHIKIVAFKLHLKTWWNKHRSRIAPILQWLELPVFAHKIAGSLERIKYAKQVNLPIKHQTKCPCIFEIVYYANLLTHSMSLRIVHTG